MTDSTAIVPMEDFTALGPAMRELNERQRAFVRSLITQKPGIGAVTRAARAAGYKGTTLRNHAHDLVRNEKVIAAIAEESKKVIRTAFPEAVAAMLSILRDPTHRDHGRVVMAMIERCDPTQTRHSIDVVHRTIDPEREALEELRAARELGATREKLVSLFGENGLDRLEALEALDNAERAMAARVIEGKETKQ
jgi:phage terminase small subunit